MCSAAPTAHRRRDHHCRNMPRAPAATASPPASTRHAPHADATFTTRSTLPLKRSILMSLPSMPCWMERGCKRSNSREKKQEARCPCTASVTDLPHARRHANASAHLCPHCPTPSLYLDGVVIDGLAGGGGAAAAKQRAHGRDTCGDTCGGGARGGGAEVGTTEEGATGNLAGRGGTHGHPRGAPCTSPRLSRRSQSHLRRCCTRPDRCCAPGRRALGVRGAPSELCRRQDAGSQ